MWTSPAQVYEPLALRFITAPQGSSQPVLQRLWQANPGALMRAMVALYEQNAAGISRVLEICQKVQILFHMCLRPRTL